MLHNIITLLFISGEPLTIKELGDLLQANTEEIETILPSVDEALRNVGLTLLVSKEGVSIVTHSSRAPLVESFWKKELQGELTPATLQVLTLVAYLGTPTREEISYIRGVQSSHSVRTLTVRGLISRQGETCMLTTDAMKQLGITKVEELPEYDKLHAQLLEKLQARNVS